MSNNLAVLIAIRAAVNGATVPGFQRTAGICRNLTTIGRVVNVNTHCDKQLMTVFRAWPKFSGDPQFPVQVVNDSAFGRATGAQQYHFTWDMWKGDYGQLRKELLDYCIVALGGPP